MQKQFISILFLFLSLTGMALNPPSMQCIQIYDNSHLKVYWKNPTNAAAQQINAYYFYCNNILVDSLLSSASSHPYEFFNSVIPMAGSTDVFSCFIVARNAAGELAWSDTIQTLNLQVTTQTINLPSGDIGRDAELSWTSPMSQLDSSWGSQYYIYKRRDFETSFSIVDSVSNNVNSYMDIADVCDNTTHYAIGINHTYPMLLTNGSTILRSCQFMSSSRSAVVIDHTEPLAPILDSVTFTENNQVMLGFHAPEPYMKGYIVYINDPYESLDTVYNQTFYIDPNGEGREYRLSVFDSCFPRTNASIITNNAQRAMTLTVSPDACLKKANLSWAGYLHMNGGVNHYNIMVSTDNGATYQLEGSSTTTSYSLTNLQLNQTYRVFVRAVNNGETITASSKRVNFTLQADASEDFSYIRSVSVINNHHVEVLVHTSGDTLPFQNISLQRSEDGINFTVLESLPYQSGTSEYRFEDPTADFSRHIYYYQTFVTNSCDLPSGYSNIAHNILLTGNASHLENIINWNSYGIWEGGVGQYKVQRRVGEEVIFSEISGGTDNTNYFDDVSTLYELGSKFTYYIKAEETPNIYGFSDTATSNWVTVEQQPGYYIPNAFTPLGTINTQFKPLNSFMPTDGTYRFTIFSRTGQVVFHTTDPNAGWDGRLNGKICPAGVYVYKIAYLIPGETAPIIKEGSVTLLH